MDQEFEKIDSSGLWQNLYNEIRNHSQECPYKVAKFPENRNRNRYRDVSPYDHSRVRLENSENDYINASLISMEEAQRRYILTQGPLRNTCGHFWLMIWEQCSKAVIMLNRIIEKGSEKCAQYWPSEEEQDIDFSDTGFVVILVSEDVTPNYTIRLLELQNSKVRESGSLGHENGPAVVHCSAGIGRSGTFSLVDTCLVLMDKRKETLSVDIQKVLLDMRAYRMGLIQTPDQLRFSYMAVMEGAKNILGDFTLQKWSKEQQEPVADLGSSPQSPIMSSEKLNGQFDSCMKPQDLGSEEDRVQSPKEEQLTALTGSLRKRNREERIASTSQKVQQMKLKLSDSEKKRDNWLFWRPILLNVGAGAALALGLCMCWAFLSQ
ncbi:tyrosine-protein phosphatase non-receptor type 2a isoform X2 [Xyrauchen texanus]|uniref:tyrosine-protein phosphatase non-receptor type 2a isoform X2 n=1 Tax=Xyrauchen texanus TaxID=154827 RepID=UPI0022424BC4|nr:tyrosine-protein phosphatase non-receptor type 2a isoform X2 [Xyrauchen texanus]